MWLLTNSGPLVAGVLRRGREASGYLTQEAQLQIGRDDARVRRQHAAAQPGVPQTPVTWLVVVRYEN